MVMETENQKAQKMCDKITLKFEDYKNCLEAAQFEKKINHLAKNKLIAEFINNL